MRFALALLALTASAAAQSSASRSVEPATDLPVTGIVVPSSLPPSGCENSRSGTFTITIQNVTAPNATESFSFGSPSATDAFSFGSASATSTLAKRYDAKHAGIPFPLLPRQNSGILTLTLAGGVLLDQANRTGYIASNYQFQFDAPPQAGAIYTGGFSLCANGSLAVGGSAIFYQCLSGTFYNLYDRNWEPQGPANHCNAVYILAIGGAGSVYSTAPPAAVSTGPSEATIPNGGGTGSTSSTAGLGGESSSSSMPRSTSAGATGSGSGSAGASAAATSASDGAAVPTGVSSAQKMLGWAAGLVGAVMMVV